MPPDYAADNLSPCAIPWFMKLQLLMTHSDGNYSQRISCGLCKISLQFQPPDTQRPDNP